MLSSTSISRFTSSIRAIPRKVVVPWFSRQAHSKATAAFLLERTSIEPDSRRPPCTRTCVAPLPGVMISLSSASAIRLIISSDKFWFPASIRCTADWLVPSNPASWDCVSPRCLRASRIRAPTF